MSRTSRPSHPSSDTWLPTHPRVVARGRCPLLRSLVLCSALLLVLGGCRDADIAPRDHWTPLVLETDGERFDPSSVDDLPDPARRFLLRAIQPGTPLARSVELRMTGEMLLDPEGDPLPFHARQILAPPKGFVWEARTESGLARISGFDRYGPDGGEMRWSLWGFLPVMRATGEHVTRSAAGRLAMEAILLPSVLVPGRGASWHPADETAARFRMTVGPETVETTLEVDAEGRPLRASAMRWEPEGGAPAPLSGEAPAGEPGYALFVVELGGELSVNGYTLPSEVEAGWWLGQEREFRFFRADLQEAVFR